MVVIMIGRKRRMQASRMAFRRHALVALRVQREVDHHDGVLLDDTDQHQDADDGDHGQVHVEQAQRHQRAHRRRRQAGQDGQRVDVALVQHAQQHVDHAQRGDDQDQLAALRALEHRRIAAVVGDDGWRQVHVHAHWSILPWPRPAARPAPG
jgi:hypothetical protein